tara:strand:- start:309 stop:995 length:687 start_codon:yes stop_codon:yes gene_type:complete
MNQPPKEYKIIKEYIDTEKMSLKGYLFFFLRIPKNIFEWLIRYLPGPVGMIIRRYYYKLILYKVGKNVVIDEGVYFQGYNIELDDWSCVDKFCVLRSFSKIRVGKRVHLGIGVVVHAGIDSEINIDDNSGIADRCNIYSLTNSYAPNKRMGGPVCKSHEVQTRSGEIYIGKECFVGVGSLILPNVKIGFGSILSSQSIVRKSIEELGIYDKDCKFLMKRKFDKGLFYK